MDFIAFSITKEDKIWVDQICKDNDVEPTYIESDGLVGDAGWLEVAVPFKSTAIPSLTIIVQKLIEIHQSTKVFCGEITIEDFLTEDVPNIIQKLMAIKGQMNDDNDAE